MTTTVDMPADERRQEVEDLTSRLADDADDRAAQLAFAIESIADDVGQLMRQPPTQSADRQDDKPERASSSPFTPCRRI
jgi:hypothetical protein